MDGILEDITNGRWWFSVVVAGLAVSLLANYIPKWFGKYVKAWGERSEKARRETEARISYLVSYPDEIFAEWSQALWYMMWGIFYGVFGVVMIIARPIARVDDPNLPVWAGVGFYLLASVLAVMFANRVLKAGWYRGNAIQARRRIRKLSEGEKEDDD